MPAIPGANDAEKAEIAYESDVSPPSRSTSLSNVDEAKLVYKIDRNVLPFICVMYLLAFLDRCVNSLLRYDFD